MEMNILPLMLSTAQDGAFDSVTPPTTLKCRRKKRTKLIEFDNSPTPSTGVIISKPKYVKPDPSAPKITRPCTECGKRFWSWKALFGHMRCHPERQWRGINPPPNLRRPESDTTVTESEAEEASAMTEEDHEVAKFLLLLANGWPSAASDSPSVTSACIVSQGLMVEYSDTAVVDLSENVNVNCRFECSSCKKVFGSRQALGGHRASHKNIKGCYAITKNEEGTEENCINEFREIGNESEVKEHSGTEDEITLMDIGGGGHKCSVCFRVFSSGQALGGHMRCHWEKMVDDDARAAKDGTADGGGRCGMNLKLPAASVEDEAYYSANSSGTVLDLRLRL